MNKILLISCLVISGCATKQAPLKQPTDPFCVAIGKYAATITGLRDIGMSYSDVNSLTRVPVTSAIPSMAIGYEIYGSTLNAQEARVKYENKCNQYGSWEKMVKAFNEERPTTLKMTMELSK